MCTEMCLTGMACARGHNARRETHTVGSAGTWEISQWFSKQQSTENTHTNTTNKDSLSDQVSEATRQ